MKRYLYLLSCLVVSSAGAASIEPKDGVQLLFINGVKVEEKRKLNDIEPGPVQLVVKYSQKLKDSGKDRVFDSLPYVIDFEAPNDSLSISIAKMYSYSQANTEFKSNPKWKISNSSDKQIKYEHELLERGDGIFPYNDMPKLLQQHNQNRGKIVGEGAALAALAQDANATVVKVAESGEKEIVTLNTSNIDQLKAWYLKASKEERKAFRRWMIDQE